MTRFPRRIYFWILSDESTGRDDEEVTDAAVAAGKETLVVKRMSPEEEPTMTEYLEINK